MSGALISAGRWLVGFDASGAPDWRYDATVRVDSGMITQIGAFEAVAYGLDHLPRFDFPGGLALPIVAPIGPDNLAAKFGAPGSLRPGSPAHIAIFKPGREALIGGGRGDALAIFIDGRSVL